MTIRYSIAMIALIAALITLRSLEPRHAHAAVSSGSLSAAAWSDAANGDLEAQTSGPVINSFSLQTNSYVGPCPAKIDASAQVIVPNGANFQYNWILLNDHGATLSKYTGNVQQNTFLQTTILVPAGYSKDPTDLQLTVADKKHQAKAMGTFKVTCTLLVRR